MKASIGQFVLFLLWNLVAGAGLLYFSPLVALPWYLGVTAIYLWGFLLRDRKGDGSRWKALRLRPLTGDALTWTLIALPCVQFLSWSVLNFYTFVVPVPPENLGLDPFAALLSTREGRLALAIFAVGCAPIIEEFVFRGLIQSRLEMRFGAGSAIFGAAFLFAVIHLLPWVFPVHLMLGAIFGFAVYATRSIWSGVILHAANNLMAVVTSPLSEGQEMPPTLWATGVTPDFWSALLMLIASTALAVWAGNHLLRIRREGDAELPGVVAAPDGS